jgi:hypothetical protein
MAARLSAKDRAKRLGWAAQNNPLRDRSRSRDDKEDEAPVDKGLSNPVVDANDQAAILLSLGFTDKMEDAPQKLDQDPQNQSEDDEMELDPDDGLDQNKKTLEEQYTDLIEYKNNLFKIETLMSLEKDESELETLAMMKGSLRQAISYQLQAIQLAQGGQDLTFNGDLLKADHLDRICLGWHPRDRRWYHGKISLVDLDKQEAKVDWIGYPETDRLKAMYVKVLPIADPAKFQPATLCECICPDDGKWQGAVIERIVDKGFAVKFRKSGVKHVGIS